MELSEIYTSFRQSLLLYIRSKVSNRDDAEDILQNVFLSITLHIHTLSDKEKIQHWLYRITRNAIIDYYRKRSRKTKLVEISQALPEEPESSADEDYTKGLDKCLKAFIGQLPDNYRSIILDSEIKRIPQKALSEKYDLPYPTLRSRVQRGRGKLHQLFSNCCAIKTDARGNILEATRRKSCEDSCGSCD